jgi:hypothetical protein
MYCGYCHVEKETLNANWQTCRGCSWKIQTVLNYLAWITQGIPSITGKTTEAVPQDGHRVLDATDRGQLAK